MGQRTIISIKKKNKKTPKKQIHMKGDKLEEQEMGGCIGQCCCAYKNK